MYNQKNVQYTFRQSSGRIWAFYTDQNKGLCYINLSRQNTWSQAVSLKQDISQSFYADIDTEDNFHILFQDKQGNIFYSRMDGSSIDTHAILRSKTPASYDKHLFLIPSPGMVHFFFVIQHGNSHMLSHQTLSESTLSSPKVIDYVTETDNPYFVIQDRTGSIYVFYQASDGSHKQIGFKKYLPAQHLWGEFTPVTKSDGDMDYPRIVTDSSNIMHLCCQKRGSRQYELIYQQKLADRNLWTPEAVIHTSAYPFSQASVLFSENRLIIYWVRDDVIYHSMSSDLGKTWSRPARYNFAAGRQLLCMIYKSNHPGDRDQFIGSYTPGSFLGGLRLAFYQPQSKTSEPSDANELRKLLLDGLNLLKTNVDDLREADNRYEQELVRIQTGFENNNKEFSKVSIKMGMLDSELSRIKSTLEGYMSLGSARNKEAAEPSSQDMSIMEELSERVGRLEKALQSIERKMKTSDNRNTDSAEPDTKAAIKPD